MKKVDLHIHTIATAVDVEFEFDLARLKDYVSESNIDAIAITNHNLFDRAQFESIAHALDSEVLPGIEINVGKGHLVLVADKNDLDDFTTKCGRVQQIVKLASDSISVQQLREIYGDLSKYLIIPHYDKSPSLDQESIEALGSDFIAGEVASAKKFIYALKNDGSPTPVLSSDSRAKSDWDFKTRQTFLDITDINIRAIRLCLADKNKVSLSAAEGNHLVQVTPDGLTISTGLTVILGGRSSGKSYTLDQIAKYNENVKYIRQFALIEMDPDKEAKEFSERISKKQQLDRDSYLKQFRTVIDDVKNISLSSDDRRIESYIASLLKASTDTARQDTYSKTALFNETGFLINDSEKLKKLIPAVETLLSPGSYAEIIDRWVSHDDLIHLLRELVTKFREEALLRRKQEWINSLVDGIKGSLGSLSAVTPIDNVDLLQIAKNRAKVQKFELVTKELQKPRVLDRKNMRRFTIEERSVAIAGAQDLKEISGKVASFSAAFSKYNEPYNFLLALQDIEAIDPSAYYKFFTKIEFSILNEYGTSVSGGERAEFRLINEVDGAANSDMLLIDEPESSFDNLFLCDDVNETIKDIAKVMPVVVVTHNNTIGASIKPDYLLYTERSIEDGEPVFRIYGGRATDKELVAPNGDRISNYDITLKYLEAGKDNYNERKTLYEMLED
jgi:hypothetical protein